MLENELVNFPLQHHVHRHVNGDFTVSRRTQHGWKRILTRVKASVAASYFDTLPEEYYPAKLEKLNGP